VALARARALVARDPRQQVAAAAVLARLQEALPTRDAYAERATALLVSAVHEDSWRAEAAFLVTAALPAASLDRVAAAAGPTPFDRSRVGYQLGRAWERRQELDRAVEAHGQAYLADATYGPPAFARGVIHRKRGELEEAEAWLRRFMESRERPGGMEGWALYFLGDLAGAEARLRRVVETEPRNAWAWTGLAEVAKQSGNRGDEREAWSRVVALSPTDANARRRLDAVSSGAP
jgi:tetratricopeptide (TPR) repeat protein